MRGGVIRLESPIWQTSYEPGVSRHIDYPCATLSEMLFESAARFGTKPAVVVGERVLDYAGLSERASRLAGVLLEETLRPGDRVVLYMPNCGQFIAGYFGVLRAGAWAVPVNPQLDGRDLDAILCDCRPAAVMTTIELAPVIESAARRAECPIKVFVAAASAFEEKAPPDPNGDYVSLDYCMKHGRLPNGLPEISPESTANLQYTGGTTGTTKAAVLTHRNLVANAHQFRQWLKGAYSDGAGGFVGVIPYYHIYGLTTSILVPVLSGAAMYPLARFDLGALFRLVEFRRPEVFMGVPSMYAAIVSRGLAGHDLSSIRACVSGSAPLPSVVARGFEALTGGRLVEGYGLTEASPVVCANPLSGAARAGSVGLPLPDTDVRIVDPTSSCDMPAGQAGELWVRGPQVMAGYWNRPAETEQVLTPEGWLRTGDLARFDAEGFVYIEDRLKDVIIAGGEKVYPREVEETLYEHPAVLEATVVGGPHSLKGEVPWAFVVLRSGSTVAANELKRFCRQRLARFKVPQVELVTGLPRNTTGKVLKRELRARLAGRPGRKSENEEKGNELVDKH